MPSGFFDPEFFDPTFFDSGLGFRLFVDDVDVTRWWRRGDSGLEIGEDVLGEFVQSIRITLPQISGFALPVVPAIGQTVDVYKGDVFFSGRISALTTDVRAGAQMLVLGCQSWGIRLLETVTGSLDKSGTIEIDRNQVIDILRDGLQGQSFGDAIEDDPILTVNEDAGWPLVQGTALVGGHDYSYKTTSAALGMLMADVPNVFLRVRPDLLVEYGVPVDQAAKALSTAQAPAEFAMASQYHEEEIVGDHRNKLRLGGEGASEVTATDEVSMARFGRVLDMPYVNDESIPAADLERLAYARLRAKRVRRRVRALAHDPDVRAGELIHIYSEGAGPLEPEGPFLDVFFSLYARNEFDGIDAHYRGETVVQKVGRRRIGPGPHEDVTLEMGDAVLDFSTTLARTVGTA